MIRRDIVKSEKSLYNLRKKVPNLSKVKVEKF